MENRVGNSHGTQIPKKSRSLDLKSLYKSKASNQNPKGTQNKPMKRKNSSVYGADVESKRKKSKKEVFHSSLKNADRNSKKSLAELYNGAPGSSANDAEDVKTGVSGNVNAGGSENGISFSLDGNAIQIPKRKRGFVGRKKIEASQEIKVPGESGGSSASSDQTKKSEQGIRSDCENVNQVDCSRDVKENANTSSNLDQDPKVETVTPASNDDLLVKKPRRNRRKKKNVEVSHTKFVQVAEPSLNSSVKTCNDLQEDDEENLEENAAMMLSLRFDPSCTGFCSKSKVSAQSSKCKSMGNPHRNSLSCRSRSLAGSDSASLDAADRILRPRKQNKQKGLLRKRRHFYEIFAEELDALWVLNKRIKVFWPLDERWYYGLVIDYDEERKLHHVKYDDRDEEWINLQNERFKLLLLRGEVTGKAGQKRVVLTEKQFHERKGNMKSRKADRKRNSSMADDSSVMDSEPIISWLARSKPSTSHAGKKRKTSVLQLHSTNIPSDDDTAGLQGDSLKRGEKKLHSVSVGRSVRTTENASTKHRKLPIVYVRRNSRKTSDAFSQKIEDDESYASDHRCERYISSVADGASGCDVTLGKSKWVSSLRCSDNSSLLDQMIISTESGKLKFELCIPVSALSYSLGADNHQLFHALLLLRHGVLMVMWPKVHLEMLFVDSIVGLRFLLFEGNLKDALAFTFMALTMFTPSNGEEKNVNLQLPATSISFKFVSVQGCRKQLAFAFYNFFALEHSKWMYLDLKLMKQCLLTKRLPLSECTYDNIKGLHNGTSRSLESCQRGLSNKGLQKKHKLGLANLNVEKDCDYMNAKHSRKFNIICGKLPPFALSFAAAPTFFLSLHLELLMRHSITRISIREQDFMEHLQNYCSSEFIELEKEGVASLNDKVSDKYVSSTETAAGTSSIGSIDNVHPSSDLHVSEISTHSQCCDLAVEESKHLHNGQKNCNYHEKSEGLPMPSVVGDISHGGSHSLANGISVEIPHDKSDKSIDKESRSAMLSSDVTLNMNGGIIPSPNPTAPRTMWPRGRSGLSSGYPSHGWSDVKADSFHNGFVNGPKKPRTQVSYLLPFGGFDVSSKHRGSHQKTVPHKRIRRPNEKKSSDTSGGPQRNFDLLSCNANVLITHGDKGWRECGVKVALELADQNEWKLAVKISGNTQYSHKAHQFLQPGSTNRYTHAMMWKGGKDWTLEFPDRSQWALFKEMHEECYNRNIRAASIKSIPIPGVRLIDDNDDSGPEGTFVRSSSKYFRQVETDIEMALNPSRILYDMDSEDENWIFAIRTSSNSENDIFREVSDEVFERIVDRFEKAAYAQQRDEFTSDEIQELMNSVGPVEVIKTVHEYWRQKRERKGIPLIRHLQPPLWERYEQQVRDWELAANKVNSTLSNGCQKAPASEKPQMFAFCMKPRGLEVPNKGSKQRSHKKISVTVHNNAVLGDHDGFHAYGRRPNGFAFGDERGMYPSQSYESLEDSPLPQTSSRLFSPRDAVSPGYFSMSSDRYYYPKLHRNKSKRYGLVSPHEPMMVSSYSPRASGWRNSVYRGDYPEWRSQRHYFEQLDSSEMDEFTLRDASAAAKHARNMAKLKREKAQKMFYRADIAIHKAVAALMTAEAMQACCSTSSLSSPSSFSSSSSEEANGCE